MTHTTSHRHLQVRAIARPEPDVKLFAKALIELAEQLAEEERRSAA